MQTPWKHLCLKSNHLLGLGLSRTVYSRILWSEWGTGPLNPPPRTEIPLSLNESQFANLSSSRLCISLLISCLFWTQASSQTPFHPSPHSMMSRLSVYDDSRFCIIRSHIWQPWLRIQRSEESPDKSFQTHSDSSDFYHEWLHSLSGAAIARLMQSEKQETTTNDERRCLLSGGGENQNTGRLSFLQNSCVSQFLLS